MLSLALFVISAAFLFIGLAFIYKPVWIVLFNKLMRERVFNDNRVLLERRKKGFLCVLLFFISLYGGYYRLQYVCRGVHPQLISNDRLLYQALQHLQSRQYDRVKLLSETVLTRDPDNPPALYYLGASLFMLNDPAGAGRAWTKARALKADCVEAEQARQILMRAKDPTLVAAVLK